MGRVIKFRAWDGTRMRGIGKNDWFSIRSDGMLSFGRDDMEIPLMQFTGLLDSKGVEIYEGDIVRYRVNDGWGGDGIEMETVEFDSEGNFGWMPFAGTNYDRLSFVRLDTCEVLGNIYQHPELLPQPPDKVN